MTHIYTCECGETFRDKNSAMAWEKYQQHRDEVPRHNNYTSSVEAHFDFTHTTVDDPVRPEPKWRPYDDAP